MAQAQFGILCHQQFLDKVEMNRLEVNVVTAEDEGGVAFHGVRLVVDGTDLADLARQAEEPNAIREGHPNLAGAYGLRVASRQCRQDLSSGSRDGNDKIPLLECKCGVPGCWPLIATVTIGESDVIWSDFEQPHRGEDSAAGHWEYKMGPFVFDRGEYDRQVGGIA